MPGIPQTQLARLVGNPLLPPATLRTYHPNALQRSKDRLPYTLDVVIDWLREQFAPSPRHIDG